MTCRQISRSELMSYLGDTATTELIPGVGFTFDAGHGNTVFGGVHRGFAPPRTSDSAIRWT